MTGPTKLNSYKHVMEEMCITLREMLQAAAAGDEVTRALLKKDWPGYADWMELFWRAEPASQEDLRLLFVAKAQRHLELAGHFNAAAAEIADRQRQERRAALAAPQIADRLRWEAEQKAKHEAEAADRYAAQVKAEQERQQRDQEYKRQNALRLQERERQNAADMARKARELAPFMP